MELPNLLNKFKSNPEEPKRFLAVEIGLNAVKTAVWQVLHDDTEVVSVGSVQVWSSQETDDLLMAIDTSLADALAGLEVEPNEVIFGLPETWVQKDSIAETKKPVLKTICQKLDLKPVGFVVSTEAVVQYLREIEGGPPSAILINFAESEIAVSIVWLGVLQGTQVVGRSQSLGADVEEGLARFPKTDNLPSRMILYDSNQDLEDAKQDLISYEWQARLPFLHFPKIESLPKDGSIRAVAVAGGAEVARSMGIAATDPNLPAEPAKKSKLPEMKINHPVEDAEPEVVTKPKSAPAKIPDVTETLGFTVAAPASKSEKTSPVSSESSVKIEDAMPEFTPSTMPEPEVVPAATKTRKFQPPQLTLPKFPKVALHTLKFPRFRFKMGFAVLLAIIPVLLLAGGAIAFWQIPRANLDIFISLQPLTKEVSFTLDPKATDVDIAASRLPATEQSVDVAGSKSIATTGTKTVGDRAKGTVTIYNRTAQPKTFSAGTVIKTATLRFTLDRDVALASASTQENADFSVTTAPSKADAAVTAVDIGDKYNLGKDTQLSIANFATDSYVAVIQSGFSGGTSREVPAVSDEDRKNIREQLLAELKEQVTAQITANTEGQGVVNTDKVEVVEETFSHKKGEETDTLNLSMSVKQLAYTYRFENVSVLAQQQALNQIPPGFSLKPDDTDINITSAVVSEDGSAAVTARVDLKLMPQIDTLDLAQKVKGKPVSKVDEYLSGLPNYVSKEVLFEPNLPLINSRFPYRSDHIAIKVRPALQ